MTTNQTIPTNENAWQAFLQNALQQVGSVQSQLLAAKTDTILTDLTCKGLLKLSGEDAQSFLQGQVTNDVKQLDGHTSQFSGYCTPKGRLLALFFAFSVNNEIFLQFEHELLESVMKRLKMYVLRAKVSISDASQTARMGVAGEQAAQYLLKIFPTIPENNYAMVQHAETTIIRIPSPTPMFEIISTASTAISIWTSLAQNVTVVEKTTWDWLEIQAGLPEISAKTQEAFVPQMVNLDALGGINLKKGCYTGQEIVARTHYLGTVKRRTQIAHIDSETQPQAGDPITDGNQQIVGQIVRASPALGSGFDVLAECRLEALEAGQLFWQNLVLNIRPLPYSLPTSS